MGNISFVFLPITLKGERDKKLNLDKIIDDKIKKSNLPADEKNILLNYPVVYIHTWKANDRIHIYVGISKDVVQRTGQHSDGIEKGDRWKEKWGEAIKGEGTDSFVFSSTMMNKSLCLDLEHSLCQMLKKQEKDEKIKLETIATTAQENYNNKDLRDDFLKVIWEKLRGHYINYLETFEEAIKEVKLTGGNNSFPYPENLPDLYCIDVLFNPETFQQDIIGELSEKEALFNWPVVYMHIWVDNTIFRTYVGETANLLERTKQHTDPKKDADDAWQREKESWRNAVDKKQAAICVFSSRHFNESLTLDIENRLIHYTIFLGTSTNGRTNEQKQYSNRKEMLPIFKGIITWLNRKCPNIFKTLEAVKEESIFLASPFLELTDAQKEAKNKILSVIECSLSDEGKTLVIVQGGAGTGKTVLASGLFFVFLEKGYSSRLIVNHKELYKIYNDMKTARKLGDDEELTQQYIFEAQKAINNCPDKMLDVMIVDEAHLLYTQGYQGGINTAQLPELQKQARVCILMIDFSQFTNQGQYVNVNDFQNQKVIWLELTEQLRMTCCDTTKNWILSLRKESKIQPLERNCAEKKIIEISGESKKIPPSKAFCFKDEKGYEIKVFDTPHFMEMELNNRRVESKFCAILATYDWEYSLKDWLCHSLPITVNEMEYRWSFFWHTTGEASAKTNVIWFANNKTDIGSVHDIQGFDLDYAALILGESVTCSNGKIEFKPEKHLGNITSLRTVGNEKINLSHELISNELYILLTRARKGLYIYAVDDNLRNELIKAIKYENEIISGELYSKQKEHTNE